MNKADHQTFFEKFVHNVIGSPEEYNLEHRFFNASCFMGGVAALFATIINIWLKLNMLLIFTTSLFTIVLWYFHRLSFKKKQYKSLIFPFIVITLAILAGVWFINAGSKGTIMHLLVIAMLLYVVLTKDMARVFAISAILIVFTALMITEYLYPELIVGYENSTSRFFDVYFTIMFDFLLVAFISSFIMKSYYDERNMVSKQQGEIIKQNREIKAAEAELIKSKKFTESIISQAQDGIIVLDLDGRFIQVNDAFEKMTQYPVQDLIGKHLKEVFLKSHNTGPFTIFELLSRSSGKNIDWDFVRKDETSFPVTVSASFIMDEEGKPSMIMAIIKDITDYKRILEELTLHKEHFEELVEERTRQLAETNKKLLVAKKKAEESDRLKSAFLSNMSHEIRTPMNAIIGFSQILKDTDISLESQSEYLNIIIDKGNLLMNIINDIIDISKVEANKMEIVKNVCNVDIILDEIHVSFTNLLSKDNRDNLELLFEKNKNQKGLLIFSDPYRLKQILTNLVSNAIKFTNKGHVKVGYEVIKDDDGHFVKFHIEDTGIGIAIENTDLIFNRFRQIEESDTREFGGTGLGLAISKTLTELLGGKIWVESELGKGSVFYFTIPYQSVKEKQEKPPPPVRVKLEYNWADKQILIVEDNNSSFLLLNSYLSHTKIKVLHTVNGKEAVSICKSTPEINLVLMDIQLPGISGYEATHQIKSFNKDMVIIAQTAYAMAGDEQKARDAGCDEYIPKPIDKEKLLLLLGKYLNS
ncbi:MAG: response regulator [Chlorobi bacterium]|nr:response regulator [Chlorobiota bacterium]